jgi:hypothetical protein
VAGLDKATVSSADKIFNGSVTSDGTAPTVNDPSKIFYGTQLCYLFLRMHHTIYSRLSMAKTLSDELRSQQLAQQGRASSSGAGRGGASSAMDIDGVVGSEMSGDYHRDGGISNEKVRMSVYTSRPAYQSFLGQLFAAIDGSIDSNRYEESCRQLLGNKSFMLITLDKVVHHALKCLQAMTNDDNVNKLIGLFVYHRCRGIAAAASSTSTSASTSVTTSSTTSSAVSPLTVSTSASASPTSTASVAAAAAVDPVLYHNHVNQILGHTMEEVYRLQLATYGKYEGDYEHVICQCIGTCAAIIMGTLFSPSRI